MDKQEELKAKILLAVGVVVGLVIVWALDAGLAHAPMGGIGGIFAATFYLVFKKHPEQRKQLLVIAGVPIGAFSIFYAAGAELTAFLVAIALSYSIVPFLRFLKKRGVWS